MRPISYIAFAIAAIAAPAADASTYTFIFDGTNSIGGLERQATTDGSELTFSDQVAFSENGIDFSIKLLKDKGRGFALVNAGGTDAGLMVYAQFPSETDAEAYPEITLTVPGGKIYDGKIYLSGPGLLSMDLTINGVRTEAQQEGALCFWSWETDGSETVTIKWDNTFFSRFIHSIDLFYSEDLGGKKASGLSFYKKSVEAIMGETFNSPKLQNPNGLPVSWSSSDPEVATVDESGNVTLIGGGKTMILASTEGNETYSKGNAKYDLTVVPSASNVPQLLEYAGAMYDRVNVNFPATVQYGYSYFAYVTDSEGNAACFENVKDAASTSAIATIYKPGDVIPAGWIASNYTVNQSVSWQGIPGNVTETVQVNYPQVSSVTPADADRVVTLMGVTFATSTPSGYEKGYGTTADGERYEFQDLYNVGSKAAGKYDVTGVVRCSKSGTREYFYIAPISYARSSTTGISSVEAGSEAPVRWYDLQGAEVAAPGRGIYIKVAGGQAEKVAR